MSSDPRFHRGLTAELRRSLRGAGVALDEELAQKAFNGKPKTFGPALELIRTKVADLMDHSTRLRLQQEWERKNPNRPPFPPSFPERVRDVANQGQQCDTDEGMVLYLMKIVAMCDRELDDEDED